MEIILHTFDNKELMAIIQELKDYPDAILWASKVFIHMSDQKGNYKEASVGVVTRLTGIIEKM